MLNKKQKPKPKGKKKKSPSGKIKLADAMRQLLENKDFYSISTDEISTIAKTNEALIYRYFGDKRGLLHQVLAEYLEQTHNRILEDLNGVKGALSKLKIIIKDTLDAYSSQKVFAKIILIEVRNFPGYFESSTFQLVRRYAQMLVDVIKEGMASGEIRNDVPPEAIRNTIIGGIEHIVLPSLLFERNIEPEVFFENIFEVLLNGMVVQKESDASRGKRAKSVSN
jgi:TetR/AcrR family transcriptional regulator, fatty acid metabolism regulator protein